ncbi:hypothetical protein PENSPDRAFT_654981 [Peniophora sp. CONT]|nr:hypothetical protein PENSPDRAFT_654981 [Peniophora sp. CONT]
MCIAAATKAYEKWANYRLRVRPRCASDEDAEALVVMLRRVLVLDPAARPSTPEVPQDPWFVS